MIETHEVTVTGGEDQGPCGDAYCRGGHYSPKLYSCTCGWRFTEYHMSGIYGHEREVRDLLRRTDHIEFVLGISE